MLKKKLNVSTFFFSTSRFLDKRPGIQNGRVWVFILETKQVQLPLWFLFSSRTWQLKLGGGPAWICKKKKKKSCSQPKTPTRAWSAAKKKERGAARAVERRSWGEKERRETQRDTDTWSCYRPADRCDEQTGELRRCGNKITFAAESPARTHDAQFSPPESGQLLRTDLWS